MMREDIGCLRRRARVDARGREDQISVVRRRSKIALFSLVLIVFGATGAVAADDLAGQRRVISVRYPHIQWVDTRTLSTWLSNPESRRPTLLDSRELDEYRVSHLRGARRVDPDLNDVSTLGLSRDALIVVYCSVGWRSGGIADRLRQAGYRRVYNLEGGLFRWANEGRAMRADGRAATVVHPYDATWGLMLVPERRAPID